MGVTVDDRTDCAKRQGGGDLSRMLRGSVVQMHESMLKKHAPCRALRRRFAAPLWS
jgi:hypothetical protein